VLRSGGDISAPALASSWSGRLGLAKLFFSSSSAALESRLAALSSAIRAFAEPDLFELHRDEPDSPYFKAADELASGGFRYIVMGHTHLARDQKLSGGGRYLNSGTWADLIRLPADGVFDRSGGSPRRAAPATYGSARAPHLAPDLAAPDLRAAGAFPRRRLQRLRRRISRRSWPALAPCRSRWSRPAGAQRWPRSAPTAPMVGCAARRF
jgi:hypothetical protein